MTAHADPDAIRAYLTRRDGEDPTVRETHISWVFLTAERAYKLKKPLVLPFLDYGTPERRRDMCREELRLNRRLAPGIYRSVVSVIPLAGGITLGDSEDGRAIDYLVEMNRYAEADTLATRLQAGRARPEDLRALGTLLAEFHAACPARHRDRAGSRRAQSEIDHNALELLDLLDDGDQRALTRTVWRFLIAALLSRGAELSERGRAGHVREAHGDVRAEHVLMTDPLQIVDCLEFDRELRTLDVSDELGFLVAELIGASAEHLVAPLLEGYRDGGGDCGEASLVAMFATHRALVRAKVARLAAEERAGRARSEMLRETGRLLELAGRLTWRARLPLTLVICGLPASGKSRLAKSLGELSGLPVLSSDVVRKRLAGVSPTERVGPARYAATRNRETYAELGRQALAETQRAGGAIVDATFRRAEDRAAFDAEFRRPRQVVECIAPRGVLLARSRQRERDPQRVSDATSEVVQRLLDDWEPLDEVAAADHLVLRSDRPAGEMISDLLARLDQRLAQAREESRRD